MEDSPLSLSNNRVLFVSYNGMLDPLGQSQVIPYLRALSRIGVRFTLLSFEGPGAYTDAGRERAARLSDELAGSEIDWHWLRYHKRPSLPATSYDVMAGRRYAGRLVRDKQIEMVHARSHIPATIALGLKRRYGVKMIFDVRGLLADEYVDAGHWRRNSIPYRVTKSAEYRALSNADGIVTLTEKIWPIIREWDSLRNRTVAHEVVPCCADLNVFRFDQSARDQRRTELGLNNQFVVVYSGSIDGWYLTEQMADFFSTLRNQNQTAHFLWLTPSRHDRIRELMRARGIEDQNYSLVAAKPQDVPSYLSAADAGLAFIKPCFSKLASSPTKYAEYLGCGLPLIINAGIGDSDDLILRDRVGALVGDFNAAGYREAISVIEAQMRNTEQTRKRSRETAEKLFDLEAVGATRYARLYERVLEGKS